LNDLLLIDSNVVDLYNDAGKVVDGTSKLSPTEYYLSRQMISGMRKTVKYRWKVDEGIAEGGL